MRSVVTCFVKATALAKAVAAAAAAAAAVEATTTKAKKSQRLGDCSLALDSDGNLSK